MATIVNNPGTTEDSSAGVVIGVVIALLIIVLFFAFALPYMRSNSGTPGVPNTGSDTGASASVNVDLPDLNPSPTNTMLVPNGSNAY
jgi:hypothetical protein